MDTFSALLAICVGNSSVPGEFPAQRPASGVLMFFLRPNKRLSKQSLGWWFETLSRPLWRHCNDQSLVKRDIIVEPYFSKLHRGTFDSYFHFSKWCAHTWTIHHAMMKCTAYDRKIWHSGLHETHSQGYLRKNATEWFLSCIPRALYFTHCAKTMLTLLYHPKTSYVCACVCGSVG